MSVIFIASATPGSDIPQFGAWDLFAKKGGHMAGYALLALSFFHALSSQGKTRKLLYAVPILLACLYAMTDEFHQGFTPGRTPSITDVGIDTIGAIIGLGVGNSIRLLNRSHKSKNPGISSNFNS